MALSNHFLEFEIPIKELEKKIVELEQFSASKSLDLREEINSLKGRLETVTRDIFNNLTPIQRVDLARHPNRPLISDYIEMVFDDFCELHGDRYFGDDRAVITGLATLNTHRVMLIGHKKGTTTEERLSCNFGMPHPEGYRKALLKMRLAEKYHLPVISMINTPGAYPGIGSEERGQAMAIAQNLFAMSTLSVPIICIIIGEGGSGGALGIGMGDRVFILENAYYSVISPEGCAAILWRSGDKRELAAKALKITAAHLLEFGVVDRIIPEPLGGAHRDASKTGEIVKATLDETLTELSAIPIDRLLQQRYQRYRPLGMVIEDERPAGQ